MKDPVIAHLRNSDYRQMPWLNGFGVSTEIAVHPRSTNDTIGDFSWRVSLSDVETDGPFSTMAGYERILMVVSGNGITLDHGKEGGQARLDALMPHWFEGDWQTRSWLIEGPVRDLNVITRYDSASGTLSTLYPTTNSDRYPLRDITTLLYCVRGSVQVTFPRSGKSFSIDTGETLRIDIEHEIDQQEEIAVSAVNGEPVVAFIGIS